MEPRKSIQLVIPMSGQGTRYQRAGFVDPKPLIPVSGRPMIERLLGCFPEDWKATFILAENHLQTRLPQVLEELRPASRQISVPVHGQGPGLALQAAIPSLDPDAPVLVSYCDFGMQWDARAFEDFVFSTGCDSCLVSYRGFHAHYLSDTKYAYSRLVDGRVVEVREKGSFTSDREREFASAGLYYFKTARQLEQALAHQMIRGLILNGETYTSLTVQALIESQSGCDVRVFEIPRFYQWGTPADLLDFEYWERTFHAWNRHQFRPKSVGHVLIPMAGMGSRFSAVTDLPKPLIPVDGRPMFVEAVASLPQGSTGLTFVLLERVRETIQGAALAAGWNPQLAALSETPPGQALSTAAGLDRIPDGVDILVSSTDHSIVLDPGSWNRFIENPEADAAIFTIRGFPGARRRPMAFAYVQPEVTDAGEFPKVARVSVKQPISPRPSGDDLLVGTFWFRSKQVLREAIEELVRRDLRVNGELYLDSALQCLIDQRRVVRKIELDGYANWGDPDSLAEALYWKETFTGASIGVRPRFPGVPTHQERSS